MAHIPSADTDIAPCRIVRDPEPVPGFVEAVFGTARRGFDPDGGCDRRGRLRPAGGTTW